MLKISIGRLKTYILIILIISSIILSGSLWFDDYHGFSAFFARIGEIAFSGLMHMGKDDIQSKYERIITPSKIIVNDGEEGHWILYTTQEKGDKLWDAAKVILKEVSDMGTKAKAVSMDKEEWTELMSKRSIVVDFNYVLDSEILSVLLETSKKKISENIVNTEKMVITTLGSNIQFYIQKLKNGQYVYEQYSLPVQDIIEDKDFDEVFSDTSLIKYIQLKEALAGMELELTYNYDVFIPIFSFAESRKDAVELTQIEFQPEVSLANDEYISQLVEKLFSRSDFSKFIKNDGTHIYIDEKNNTLKIYPDGRVEFEYDSQSGIDTPEVSFENALKTAVSTVEKFTASNDLYISSILSDQGQYQFKFNYIVNNMPVVVSKPDMPSGSEDAIEVTVYKNHLNLNGFILDTRILDEKEKLSSDNDSIINAVFAEAGPNAKKIGVDDVRLAYKVKIGDKEQQYPVWVVKCNFDDTEKLITVKASESR